ncbi:uncharacterized protein METZ01_LOCUS267464, partial [marine metagenome]
IAPYSPVFAMFSFLPAPRLSDHFRCDNSKSIPTSGKAVKTVLCTDKGKPTASQQVQ